MVKRFWLAATVLSAVCVLLGCGGGGGGSDAPVTGGSPSPVTPAPESPVTGEGNGGASWLTFSPTSISQTVKERSFTVPITVMATSTKVIPERLNVAIVDSVGVFDPNGTSISGSTGTSYKAELAVSSALKPGRYRGALKVNLCLDDPQVCQQPYEGSPWQIPFDIEVKPWQEPRAVHKLLVSEVGVALTGAPNLSRLTKSITVSDNLGQASRWQAQSDQSWLTVTPSGAAGEALKIQADPFALAANSLSYATILVTSPDATVAAAQPVVVALWKSGDSVRQIPSTSTMPEMYTRTLADAIRPHVYVHSGGSKIDVYNIYTGALVGSMSAPGASLGKMMASPDGAFLYAVDNTGSQLKVFDLRAGQLASSWPFNPALDVINSGYVDMVYARPNGVGVVVLTTGQIIRASDGKVLATKMVEAPRWWEFSPKLASSYLAASHDGTRIYSTDSRRYGPNMPFYWDIDYSEANGGMLSFTKGYEAKLSGTRDERLPQAGGIAISRDGKRVLMLSYSSGISVWTPQDLSRNGMLSNEWQYEAHTLFVTVDGNVIVENMSYGSGRGPEFHVLSPEGARLKTVNTSLPASTIKSGDTGTIYTWADNMAVSADGVMAIQRAYHQTGPQSSEYLLTFTPIVP